MSAVSTIRRRNKLTRMSYKLVVMGSSSVGKSALTVQLVKNCFVPDHDPTIEDSYRTQLIVDGQACQLDILDTTGNEELLSRRQQFMRWGEGFLCVYAVDDIKSFVDVNIFRDQLRRIRDADRIPFVLVANKVDLGGGQVTSALGQEAAKSYKVPFVETSAQTRQGVEHAFQQLVREVQRARVEALRVVPEPPRRSQSCACTLM
ncbi:GTPase NRas-like [Phascolarctos cinereus]|uniref:small monomeric GTPase n=1 Tax=Phascolarctos cinereus TaxID=38626 RepID=A0A6P5JVK9_PHACI|nr:GTPase NRas-like [Phascolarctos cinereus]